MDNFHISDGWWKTTVFHLKHSYLNWRASLCRRKMICVHAIFHHFLELDSLDFHLDLIKFLKCVIWQSIFLFSLLFLFFVLMVCLLRATTHVIDGPPSWSISSHVRIVLKGWPFGSKLFRSFLSKERIMAQKYFREMGNFGQRAPRHQSRWFQNITILGFCLV